RNTPLPSNTRARNTSPRKINVAQNPDVPSVYDFQERPKSSGKTGPISRGKGYTVEILADSPRFHAARRNTRTVACSEPMSVGAFTSRDLRPEFASLGPKHVAHMPVEIL